jgi:ubiquinone/menaquinone biosynthesis C-methylase UbiE
MPTPRDINEAIYRATDPRGIGMLDPKDKRGRKNAYIDLLHKEAIGTLCPFTGRETVLEYGCGAGRIAGWLGERTREVVAADVDPKLLDTARRFCGRENVTYVQVERSETPFVDGSFDIITCIGLFRFMDLEEVGVLLGRFRQLLRPGGRLLCLDNFYRTNRPNYHTVEELRDVFEHLEMGSVEAVAIRKAHWLPLYLVRFGMIPRAYFRRLARYEMRKRRSERSERMSSWDYYQYVFYYRHI